MMQKINIKNTTKATMYAMLCAADKKCEELEDSHRQLKNDSSMRIDHLSEDLAEAIEAKLYFRNLSENRREKIDQVMIECANLEADLKWANEHPWKHLWRCLTGGT